MTLAIFAAAYRSTFLFSAQQIHFQAQPGSRAKPVR